MKAKKKVFVFKIIYLVGILLNCPPLFAQGLPGVQKNSVYAPSNLKIDGKATEWDNKFQAKNKATEIFYTLANGKDNLYLIVQATDILIAKKILGGGLTFTVNTSALRDPAQNKSITFPISNPVVSSKIGGMLIGVDEKSPVSDSLLRQINNELVTANKEIKLKRFKDLSDTLLSVYNEEGIKTAIRFDANKVLTIELAIPYKCLEISSSGDNKFKYNLMLNGMMNTHKMTPAIVGGGQHVMMFAVSGNMIKAPSDFQTLNSATDFWGEYTLANKSQ